MLVRSKVSPETKPEIVLLGIAEPPICNWPPLPLNVIPPLTTAPLSRSSTALEPPINGLTVVPPDKTVSLPPLLTVVDVVLTPTDTVSDPPL